MYSICYRYTQSRELCLDMVNLSFAKIMLNLKKYDTAQPIEKWLATIAINTVIDEFRKTKTYKENIRIYDQEALKNMVVSESEFAPGEITEAIAKKLAQLPEMTRTVFTLYIDGYKHKEIAEMLKIPEGTSHWHFSVARKAVKEHLRQEFSLE